MNGMNSEREVRKECMQQLSESAWELDCCTRSRRLSCGGYDITFFVICLKMRVRLTDVQHSRREWAKRGKMPELVDYVKSEALGVEIPRRLLEVRKKTIGIGLGAVDWSQKQQ